MHCRTCGYALWNLTEPRCPECGTAFDLRSYRFAPQSVAFACPHCGNLHAGAGESYLPADTDEATCQACAQPMRVTHMRVVPLAPNPPDAIAFTLPWEDRASVGWFKAWWQTTKLGMLKPSEVVRQARPRGTWGTSYLYAVTTYGIGIGVNAILFALIVGIAFVVDSGDVLSVLGIAALIIAGVVIYAFVAPLMVWLFSAVPAHAFLWLFAPERRGAFADTARFVNYAQAPMALLAIPVCGYHIGGNVGWIWTIVCSILMLRTVHDVSGLKASLAVLWLLLAFVLLYIGLLVVVFVVMAAQPSP